MPQLSSSLSTPSGVPAINAAHVGKFGGAHLHFPSQAAWLAAVTDTNTTAAWSTGQPMTKADEFDSRARRLWSVALGHARTVAIGHATEFVLAANSNVVLAAPGKPASGTGADGDVSVDRAAGKIYLKTAGAWAWFRNMAGVRVVNDPISAAATLGLEALDAVTPVTASGNINVTLPSAASAYAQAPGGMIGLDIKGAGVPTFVKAGSDSLRGTAPGGAQYGIVFVRVISSTEWAYA